MDNSQVDVNVIYAFNAANLRIIHINGRYYKIEFWQEATNTILKHNLKGADITEKLVSSPQLATKGNEAQITSIMMDIMNIKPRVLDFSKETQFVIYT